MAQLDKADLEQMTDDYLQSLEPERLVAVAKNLRALAVAQLEKLVHDGINKASIYEIRGLPV